MDDDNAGPGGRAEGAGTSSTSPGAPGRRGAVLPGGEGDIAAVRTSLERVRRRSGHVIRYFYAHLFSRHPHLRSLFPEVMDDQYDRMFSALVHVVEHLTHPGLPARLERLGRDHRRFGVADADYPAVGASLVAALRHHSQATWDPRTEAAWLRTYEGVAAHMTAGARRSAAARETVCWEATVLTHRLHGDHTAVIRAAVRTPYPWLPGQYATLEHQDLPGVWRPYSLAGVFRPTPAGAAERERVLEFHVGRVPGGRLSRVLCDATRPGQRLRLGPASGSALAPAPGTPAVTLIAAGTGWAPVKPVLAELLRRRPAPRIRVDAVASGEAHFYDGAFLDGLLRDRPWLSAYWWYEERGEGLIRAAERLHEHLRARRDWADESVYLCGPPGFVHETAELLFACGLPPDALIRDPQPMPAGRRGHVSHAEACLDAPSVRWIDPDARLRAFPDPGEPDGDVGRDAAPAEDCGDRDVRCRYQGTEARQAARLGPVGRSVVP
ncbi:globin domain-containing protein, partial [Streptomyces sp. NPDC020875]|uniref:globin domain-containing protein n=1 Tax=Streptomyces sp. NPDC020875 TaxID=3154898 RepID=UPI0033D4D64A